MKNLRNTLISALALVTAACVAQPAHAQLTTTSTTLSAAVAAGGGNSGNPSNQWCVGSATGINLPSISQAGSYLAVDKEVAQVSSAGATSTCFNVKRGSLGTNADRAHASGATVWVTNVATGSGSTSSPFTGGLSPNVPSGTCTASAQYTLPVVIYGPNNSPYAGGLARCLAGTWSVTTLGNSNANVSTVGFTQFSTIPVPNGIATSSVTDIAGQVWWSEAFFPTSATLTGACVLNGSSVGTDKWIFALYDSAGNLLANTATAGVTTATASKYQCIAFTGTIAVVGPGTYFLALQGNGTTDTFQAYATASVPTGYITGHVSGSFGTLAAITPGTTFTAANGPLMMVY